MNLECSQFSGMNQYPLHDYGATDKNCVGDVSSWSTQTIRINPASDITLS